MSDWDSFYGSGNRSVQNENHKTGLPSRVVYTPNGTRTRQNHTKQGFVYPGLRKCSAYVRRSTVASNATATIRNDAGVYSYVYPERLHALDFYNHGSSFDWKNMTNRAEAECLVRLGDQKVQLLNDLLEAKKTFDMLSEAVTRGGKFLLALKRGQFVEAGKHLFGPSHRGGKKKTLADYWLEYQYGWKPLASSVHDYQELLKSHADKRRLVRVVREIKQNLSQSFNGVQSYGYYNNARGTLDHHLSVKVVLYAELMLDYIQAAKRWGVYDPASIAWEAVPYSFVVDWFMPVGNVLSAWSATGGFRFLTGCKQARALKKGNLSLEAVSVDLSYNTGVIVEPSRYQLNMVGVDRTVYTSWPRPLPYFKNPFSDTRAVTALALLRQLRG